MSHNLIPFLISFYSTVGLVFASWILWLVVSDKSYEFDLIADILLFILMFLAWPYFLTVEIKLHYFLHKKRDFKKI